MKREEVLARLQEIKDAVKADEADQKALIEELNELREFKEEVIRVVTEDANTMQGVGRFITGIVNKRFLKMGGAGN